MGWGELEDAHLRVARYDRRAAPLGSCKSCTAAATTAIAMMRGGLGTRGVGDAAAVRNQLLAHIHSKH